MLTPVSFKKGRASAPRLSDPQAPGRHSKRFWTEAEIDVVRQHFGQHGAAHCASRLPGRSMTAVYQQALKMGLSRGQQQAPKVRVGTSLDETIRARWPLLQGRGAVEALASELGVRRHTVTKRAIALGPTVLQRKEPPWTAVEEALLLKAPLNDLQAAVKFFAAYGFRRSPTSIAVRCSRLKVSRRRQDVFSATTASKVLGVSATTIASWCVANLLSAEHSSTRRLPQQGGDTWTITRPELRRFIIDQLDRIDIRKVDKHAFVELLIGEPCQVPAGAPGR